MDLLNDKASIQHEQEEVIRALVAKQTAFKLDTSFGNVVGPGSDSSGLLHANSNMSAQPGPHTRPESQPLDRLHLTGPSTPSNVEAACELIGEKFQTTPTIINW